MAGEKARRPEILVVDADRVAASVVLHDRIAALRATTDACIFLSGGASNMSRETRTQLMTLFDAIGLLVAMGVRVVVGDGGTRAGIMEAAGLARRASGDAFPLVGVAPAAEVLPLDAPDRTPVDPDHSLVVAVNNPSWSAARARLGWSPADGYWGAETTAMYEIFGLLARQRPSVTLVANGGTVVLDEVRANVDAGRTMVLIAGSGRVTDLLVTRLGEPGGTCPPSHRDAGQADADLAARAAALGLPGPRALYQVFNLESGAPALAAFLRRILV